jgi:hypothetical protein
MICEFDPPNCLAAEDLRIQHAKARLFRICEFDPPNCLAAEDLRIQHVCSGFGLLYKEAFNRRWPVIALITIDFPKKPRDGAAAPPSA